MRAWVIPAIIGILIISAATIFGVITSSNTAEAEAQAKAGWIPVVADLQTQITAGVSVPVGTVLDWFCTGPCTIPDGFVLADGSTVDDPASPLDGVTLPDLRQQFVRGAQTTASVGNTGGASSHTHSVDPTDTSTTGVGSHLHSVNPPPTFDNFSVETQQMQNCVASCTSVSLSGHEHGLDIGTFSSSSAGSHSHSVDIVPFNSASGNNSPPFVDLVKIIRIK